MADRRYQGSSSRRGAKDQGGYRGQGGYIGKMSQDRSPKSRNSRGGQKGGRGRGAGRPQRPAPVRSDMLMIEGRRAVAEALDTGVKLTRAYVSAPDGDASLQELMSRLEAANVPIEEVSHRELDARSSHGAHQGIMVKCAPFAYASVRDIINRAGGGPALVVLLDHVTDEGNFGAMLQRSYWGINAGIRKTFFNKRLTLGLQANDLWNSRYGSFMLFGPRLTYTKKANPDSRSFSLNLSYRFNAAGKAYKGKHVSEQDLKRL